MLSFKNKINHNLKFPIYEPYKINEIVFFDIETTGFSANTSYVYLIGCMYYENHSWHIIQWLLDNPNNERDLLYTFYHFIKTYKSIIHYNGSGFDIPYLLKKYEIYKIPNPFSSLDSFDLYKNISPYRKLFPFPNLQLHTLEKHLGYNRTDHHSGEDLIDIYSSYIGRLKYEKLVNQDPDTMDHKNLLNTKETSKDLADILLLHNYDDIIGLLDTSIILLYTNLLDKGISNNDILKFNTNVNKDQIIVSIEVSKVFPYEIMWSIPIYNESLASNYTISNYSITIKENHIIVKAPLIRGKLQYFFENYKEYYYLPKEDRVLHKSVAQYVDKEYRIQANPSNCYTYILPELIIDSKDKLALWFNSLLAYIVSNKNSVLVE